MDWVFVAGLALYFLVLLRFAPELFAPHCPLCSAQMEAGDVETFTRWNVRLGLRHFVCPQCLYVQRRLTLHYETKEVKP
jgi:hypothetical protein